MRLDRAFTLGVAAPWHRWRDRDPAATPPLPLLMYHGISTVADDHALSYHHTRTSPRRFSEQMAWLAADGWCGLSVTEALAAATAPTRDGRRPVALTFDDGLADFVTHALPALRRHNFTATLYLPTAFIGNRRRHFQGAECITWTEARTLREEGIELGAHTVTHPRLVDLGEEAQWRELVDARREIEHRTGGRVRAFSYPYAFPSGRPEFVRRLRAMVPVAGYAHCATTMIGRFSAGDDPTFLPRLPVNDEDDRALFRAKLAGDYDWLAAPQGWLKRIRAALPATLSA